MKITKDDIGRFVNFREDHGYGKIIDIETSIDDDEDETEVVVLFIQCEDETMVDETWYYTNTGNYIWNNNDSIWDLREFITPETHPQYFI